MSPGETPGECGRDGRTPVKTLKRRERAAALLESGRVDSEALRDLHADQRNLPLPEKIRQVLVLQKIDYAVRSARGELRSWERPWEIEP